MLKTKDKLTALLSTVARAFEAFSAQFEYGKTSKELFEPFLKVLKAELGTYELVYDYIWGKDTAGIDGVTQASYIPQNGDTVIMDISVYNEGVWCDVTRTFFVGGVTDEQQRRFEMIINSLRAGERELKVGAPAAGVYHAVNTVLQNNYHSLVHHAGHKIGTAVLEEPRFVPESFAVIEESGVYTLEPGCYDGYGIRLENDYYVDENGAENLFENFWDLTIGRYILHGKKY